MSHHLSLATLCALLIYGGTSFADERRGPKPKGDGPHNIKVEAIIRRETAKGKEHLGGGVEQKERMIQIEEGGKKSARRADATFLDPLTKEIEHHQVGRTDAKGEPVKREREALDDIRNHAREKADRNVTFHPFTPTKKK